MPPVSCLLNWPAVRAVPYRFGREGCAWITDASIEECLRTHHLEDVSQPQVKATSHHAARIAALITLLREGADLDPIDLRVATKIWIADGSHRLRAYQYLGRTDAVPAIVSGHLGVLCGCFIGTEPVLPPVSIVPHYEGFSWWSTLLGTPKYGFAKNLSQAWMAALT